MKFSLKRTSFLVIISLIITNFLLGNVVLVKGIKITDKDMGRIKTGLSLMKALVNYTIGDNTLKTALNMTIGGGEIGTDITYGLVVLTAINEMDFIDMVVSQRYKQEATAYFDQVINERTNLMSFWKGVGYDLPRVAMGYITGPMASLTLNSFSITDKIISIFAAVNVIKQEKLYDGLWYYFSLRRENKMVHQEAWEDAKLLMGWAVNAKIKETGAFVKGKKSNEGNLSQLESQFAALWDKWGPYIDSKGVIELAKQQFGEEMGQIVAEAIEKQALAEKSKELSLLSKAVEASKNFIKNAAETVKNTAQNIFSAIKSTVSQFNPFGAGVTQSLSSFIPEDEEIEESEESLENVGVRLQQPIGGPEPRSFFEESQNQLDDIAERVDILDAEMTKLVKENGVNFPEGEEKGDEIDEEEIEQEETVEEEGEEKIDDSEEKEEAEDKDFCSVDINTASKEGLEKITGVGPTIAQRIIEIRPFYSLNDLTRVSGIGEITLQKIIVQACAYVSGYVGGGSGSGGASAPPPPSELPTYQKILISEIQIASQNSEKDDFVEFYNPNDEDIDLTDWYLQRKTESASDFSTYAKKDLFSGKEILAKDYFLVANASSSFSADILTAYPLTEDNTLALKNPNQEIVDKVGWGNSQDFETATATSPQTDKSIGRTWSTTTESYSDTDNNQNDFELQTPTPRNQNQSPEQEPEEEESLLSVVINEIAWMGTAASSTDEWLELHNNTTSTIDLAGWTLSATDGTPSIAFSLSNNTTTIPALGFYLLERTNDQTISDISADQIYTGALENEGEKLELRDTQNNLIDLVDCSSGWFTGSSSPDYISMERINPNSTGTLAENWANNNLIIRNGTDAGGNPINGTPKAQNSAYQSLSPNPVSNLSIDSENSFANKVVLFWSSSTDPDTLSENLSYKIYYSKENLNEDNLVNASTSSTTATAITIPDLDYNSTYYFGIKVFDGQNYSPLSNVVSRSIPSALIDSPWQMSGGSFQRSNQSQYLGPTSAPAINWIYDEDNSQNTDLNPLYTSPIIRPEGTIFSSVIYPATGQGILALNSDGSKKSFQQTSIDKSLVLQSDGSVLVDDGKTKDEQGKTYLNEGNALKKIDGQGNIIWQRNFEFENPYSCSTSTPAATSPAIGENGIIYTVVKNNSCNQNGDNVDYLYLVSTENEILETVNLSGYRSSLSSVSLGGTAYISFLIYGAGPPWLYLTAASSTGEILWMKQIVSNYSNWTPSPVLIDNQENLYFVVGKDVFAWNKDGNEIWKIYLGESVPANWYVGDIGIVLNNDSTLYLSGRGAILGLK